MTTRIATSIASIVLTGSVALAFLPTPQPQPVGPLVAPVAVAFQDDATPELTCPELCLEAFNSALDEALESANECEENASGGASLALQLCQLYTEPAAVQSCIDAVRIIHAFDLANCDSARSGDTYAAYSDYFECVNNCPG